MDQVFTHESVVVMPAQVITVANQLSLSGELLVWWKTLTSKMDPFEVGNGNAATITYVHACF